MQIVSNYPNVPVATTNVATDSARVDNQQRPPLLPPQQLSKTHQERGLETRQERATEQQQERLDRISERQSGQQQQQAKEQQDSPRQQLPQAEKAALVRLAARGGALSRKDIRDRTQGASQPTSQQPKLNKAQNHPMPNEAPKVYRQIGAHISAFYQAASATKELPQLELQA